MRFGLDEDQQALRAGAREILSTLCPPAVVRAAWAQPPDLRPWQALDEAGALTALATEAAGGLGLDETHMVPVLEEAGRVALPHPLTETALVAAPLGIVGRIVTTNLATAKPTPVSQATVSLEPLNPAAAETNPPTTGSAITPSTGVLSPEAASSVVPAATYSTAFLLLTEHGELRLHDADEVELEHVGTVDAARHAARVRPRGQGELVTSDPRTVMAAFDRGVLGTAAELVGLSRTMLELTVGYVAQRQQFGKPVGSFQAIKHHLANARLQIEFAAPAVLHAAYMVAQGHGDARRCVSQAKCLAGLAANETSRAALQCHGAIGYTTEHDLHLFMKRSWALTRAWGSSDFHTDRVATQLGL